MLFTLFKLFKRKLRDPEIDSDVGDEATGEAPPLVYIERVFSPGLRFLAYVVYVVLVAVLVLYLWLSYGIEFTNRFAIPSLVAVIFGPWVVWMIYIDWRCPTCGKLLAMTRKVRTGEIPDPEDHNAVDGPPDVIGGLRKTGARFLFDQYYRDYEYQRDNRNAAEDHYLYDVHVARCDYCGFSVVRFRTKLNPWRRP